MKSTTSTDDPQAVRRAATVVGVGLLVGALSFLVQGRLPGDWAQIGNSGAVWLTAAFFMGAAWRSAWRAALAGLTTLAACLLGYFGTGSAAGVPYAPYFIVLWFAVALFGGPLFGLAGYGWRATRRVTHAAGIGLMGGVFIAEGLFTLVVNAHLTTGWPLLIVGAALPLVLGRSRQERLLGLAASLGATVLGAGVYALITWLTSPAAVF